MFAGEVDQMRARLAEVAAGRAFFLTGGDCAETFAAATADRISARVRTLLQMAVVLTYGASMPVVKMGRMAGQFSKPRSSDTETRGETTLPSFRGEMVNGFDFTPESRAHDPNRMLAGYHTSASTLNLIRAFTTGGFADLRLVHAWNQGFVANPAHARYESMAAEIDRAMKFMAACGADFEALRSTEFYAGHEALLLDYERALTRIDSRMASIARFQRSSVISTPIWRAACILRRSFTSSRRTLSRSLSGPFSSWMKRVRWSTSHAVTAESLT